MNREQTKEILSQIKTSYYSYGVIGNDSKSAVNALGKSVPVSWFEEFHSLSNEGFNKVPEENWDDVRHMFWVLMRSLERLAEDTSKGSVLFERRDVEGAYRIWNENFSEGQVLYPSWLKNS